MIMRTRRSIYATRYIGETVEAFQNYLKDNSTQCASLIKWATSVLDKYFELFADGRQVECVRTLFIKVRSKINESPNFLPQKRSDYKDNERPLMFISLGYADPLGLVTHSEKSAG